MYRLWIACLMAWACASRGSILSQSVEPRVCSPNMGCVRGTFMPGYDTEKFEAFLGIPFALPPINDLRFKDPQAMPSFISDYNATEIKPDCIQKNYLIPARAVLGEEDCLYLNVYRPLINSSLKLLPVMVYIFGGGWFSGSSSPLVIGPEYFMDTKEVIMVAMNYRLGALGFLSTNDDNMPGNLGLKDQKFAIEWVQKNIFYFGGNPEEVTLFGQSAGACSAHMLLLGGRSKGLFRNIIAMSGTANIPFVLTRNPVAQTREVANFLNITNADNLSTAELATSLRNFDAKTLVDVTDKFKYWDTDPTTVFRPIVENKDVEGAIITVDPIEIMTKGSYEAMPLMNGFVENEGGVRAVAILENDELIESFNNDFDHLLIKLMELPNRNLNQTQMNAILTTLVDVYFDGQHALDNENEFGLDYAVGDRGFTEPLYKTIAAYVDAMDTETHPTYLYKFSYQGTNTYASIYAGAVPSRDYGAVHCDDLIYIFRSPAAFPDFAKNSTDAAVMRAMVANFVNFAKKGKPLNADQQRPCNKRIFQTYGFCDYQEFKNADNGAFDIATSNGFRLSQTKLWSAILDDLK